MRDLMVQARSILTKLVILDLAAYHQSGYAGAVQNHVLGGSLEHQGTFSQKGNNHGA